MGNFSVWHWMAALLLIVVVFSIGRPKALGRLRFAGLMFFTGVLLSALMSLIILITEYGYSEIAFRFVIEYYYEDIIFSGFSWLLIGFFLKYIGIPRNLNSWTWRIAATGFALPLMIVAMSTSLQIFTMGILSKSWIIYYSTADWFDFLRNTPNNILTFVQAALLVRIAAGPLMLAPAWSPHSVANLEPDQVTRILCGQAILGGPEFRRGVLQFFENRWTATAPEFGLDAQLLASVCRGVEKQEERESRISAALAMIGFLLALIPTIGPILLLGVAAVTVAKRYQKIRTQRDLARSFSALNFNREMALKQFAGALEEKTAVALPSSEQNVVVYHGFSPFVGAGFDSGGWSLVSATDRPKIVGRECDIRPFTVPDLYRAVEEVMREAQIPGLRCRDLFFIRGMDVRNVSDLLPDLAASPLQSIKSDLVEQIIEEHGTLIRDYKCIQVFGWGGELVASYFLRCSLQPTSLMVEFKQFLLPPLHDSLRQVDGLGPDRLWSKIEQMGVALVVGPLVSVFSVFTVFGRVQEQIFKAINDFFWSEERKSRKRRRQAEDNQGHDYGATTTLRSHYAQNNFHHYFQKMDSNFYNKVIEQKILSTIEYFLGEHGIDTTDIRERQTTIMNHGILVQGGDVRAESLAVGENARASKVEKKMAVAPKETVA